MPVFCRGPRVNAPGRPPDGFAVEVEFTGLSPVVAVRGEVDMLTAGELGSLLRAVVDQHHPAVVLDLSDCDFFDAAGLQVIADTAKRLAIPGGLTIRSAPLILRRLFEITGMSVLVALEDRGAPGGQPAARRPAEPAAPWGPRPKRAINHLRMLTAHLADDDVIDAALRLVVALAQASVGGADGASVSLRRRGRLFTVAASDDTVAAMDATQYATGEGPCVQAAASGQRVHARALPDETRWPAFTPGARRLGIQAILSSPLLTEDRPMGALNIYSRTAAAFTPPAETLASVFAAQASQVLTQAWLDRTDDELTDRLNEALRTRQLIAEAQGVLMERGGLSAQTAYTALRRSATREGQTFRAQAEEVIASVRIAPPAAAVRPDVGAQEKPSGA